jgi:hypothetical protein
VVTRQNRAGSIDTGTAGEPLSRETDRATAETGSKSAIRARPRGEPRNVSDVDYAEIDGMQPMREVIRERNAKARKYTRAQLEAAYRARAGMQVSLMVCLCHYPFTFLPTLSGHEDWCPSDHMRRSFEAADARNADSNTEPPTDTKGTDDHGTTTT